MENNMAQTFNFLDKLSMKYYNYMYTASIAKEAVSSEGNSGGIFIIGMIVAIVAIIGFILTSNKK